MHQSLRFQDFAAACLCTIPENIPWNWLQNPKGCGPDQKTNGGIS
jgi:hypothetical protein